MTPKQPVQKLSYYVDETGQVDLTDEVAQQLNKPLARISLEMVYRSLPFFTRAHQRGEANDLIVYLAAHAKDLGILKRIRSDKPSRLRSLQLTIAQIA
jgi:hypothetical protein